MRPACVFPPSNPGTSRRNSSNSGKIRASALTSTCRFNREAIPSCGECGGTPHGNRFGNWSKRRARQYRMSPLPPMSSRDSPAKPTRNSRKRYLSSEKLDFLEGTSSPFLRAPAPSLHEWKTNSLKPNEKRGMQFYERSSRNFPYHTAAAFSTEPSKFFGRQRAKKKTASGNFAA